MRPTSSVSRQGPRRIVRPARGPAFTLIEIMLVVGIMGIVLAMGLPPMVRTLRKEPIRQAASDIEEGLKQARAYAILSGSPAEFVLQADPLETGDTGATITVQPVSDEFALRADPRDADAAGASSLGPSTPSAPPFQARLHPDVRVSFLEVNLVSQMANPAGAHARFFPNGTSDDFAIVLEHPRGVRKIQVDAVTGLPDMEVVR